MTIRWRRFRRGSWRRSTPIYSKAIQYMVEGRVSIEGRRVLIREDAA